jgi:hypothetical protein
VKTSGSIKVRGTATVISRQFEPSDWDKFHANCIRLPLIQAWRRRIAGFCDQISQ